MLGFIRATSLVTVRRHGHRGISSYANPKDLMVPTLKKWLWGDKNQSQVRRLNFDVEALKQIARRVTGATCTDIKVTHEGSFNRIFTLKLEGSRDIIARIPFRSAGPRGLLTKSEVATMDFVRMKFAVPIPKVLAWDPSPYNPVGCEYILMEKCPGMSLAKKLPDTSIASLYVTSTAQLMGAMANVQFSQFGSIYYKEDVDESLQARPLYASGMEEDECSERFRIGPTVDRAFYRLDRANMEIDRGPWPDAYSYLKASAECEMKWMESRSITSQRHVGPRHSANSYISALKNWIAILPALLPPSDNLMRPTLTHPCLSSKNIFIEDTDLWDISGILGWQGAKIQPLFLVELPEFVLFDTNSFKYTKSTSLPDNFKQLAPNEQAQALEEQAQLSSRHRFFVILESISPALWEAWLHHKVSANAVAQLSSSASYAWAMSLPWFEYQLIQKADKYGKAITKHPKYPDLPVTFSPNDRKRNAKDLKDLVQEQDYVTLIKKVLKAKGIEVGFDGSVKAEDYLAAQEEAKLIYNHLLSKLGKRDSNVFKLLWPLRSNKFVDNQESCISR